MVMQHNRAGVTPLMRLILLVCVYNHSEVIKFSMNVVERTYQIVPGHSIKAIKAQRQGLMAPIMERLQLRAMSMALLQQVVDRLLPSILRVVIIKTRS